MKMQPAILRPRMAQLRESLGSFEVLVSRRLGWKRPTAARSHSIRAIRAIRALATLLLAATAVHPEVRREVEGLLKSTRTDNGNWKPNEWGAADNSLFAEAVK